MNIGRNLIHGSDAIETAQREISLWFSDEELVTWESQMKPCYKNNSQLNSHLEKWEMEMIELDYNFARINHGLR